MKKDLIIGIVIGSCLTAAVGVTATSLTATLNTFPVQLNGNNVSIEGYNINNNTYFKLRDIADVVGSFSVGFNDNTIQLSKDGYTYTNYNNYDKYIGTYERLGGSLGFNWILGIESITDEGITFSYTYEKPGSDYIVDFAAFTTQTTATCTASDGITYSITLQDDSILLDKTSVNGELIHQVFNLN